MTAGLVTITADAGRKLVTLTDAGREHVEFRRATAPDPFGCSPTGRNRPTPELCSTPRPADISGGTEAGEESGAGCAPLRLD